MQKPFRLVFVVLIILALLVSINYAEARTFRKPVSNDFSAGDEVLTVEQKPVVNNGQAATSTNCESIVKKVRGKRVVTQNCGPQTPSISKLSGESYSPTSFASFADPHSFSSENQVISDTIVVLNTNDVVKTKEAVNLIRNKNY